MHTKFLLHFLDSSLGTTYCEIYFWNWIEVGLDLIWKSINKFATILCYSTGGSRNFECRRAQIEWSYKVTHHMDLWQFYTFFLVTREHKAIWHISFYSREMQEKLTSLSEDVNNQKYSTRWFLLDEWFKFHSYPLMFVRGLLSFRWLFVTEEDIKNLPCFQVYNVVPISIILFWRNWDWNVFMFSPSEWDVNSN